MLKICILDAQLTAPDEAVCPGNHIFICQQTGFLSSWTINLPSVQLHTYSTVRFPERVRSTFQNDPGFHFEVHITSNSTNITTSELQVTAVRELDGVTGMWWKSSIHVDYWCCLYW